MTEIKMIKNVITYNRKITSYLILSAPGTFIPVPECRLFRVRDDLFIAQGFNKKQIFELRNGFLTYASN
jgi:hypothetical protein